MKNPSLALFVSALLSGVALAQQPATVLPPVMLDAQPGSVKTPPTVGPTPPAIFNVGPAKELPLGQPASALPPRIVSTVDVPPAGPRFWTSFEYLLWYAKGAEIPPLVSVLNGSAAYGRPLDARQRHVLNDDSANDGIHSGFRVTAGFWFDNVQSIGVEGNYTWFVRDKDTTMFNDGPGTVLARPYVNSLTGNPALFPLSTPTGSTRVAVEERTTFDVDGAEVNALFRGPSLLNENLHFLAGFRYLSLDESLRVESISATKVPKVIAGAVDEFSTRNRFYGGQIGVRWSIQNTRWSFDATGKLAIGGMSQESTIAGSSAMIVAGHDAVTASGGLLALNSNIGRRDRTQVVFIPEIALNLGYRITSHLSMFVGYDFMYVSNVLRPGGQIDPLVNPTRLPLNAAGATGNTRPYSTLEGESFWMQGINFGVAFRY